jgi:type III pantothenate kinase
MRFKALQSFTYKLPHVQRSEAPGLSGDSTASCIQAGVQVGSAFEVQGFIDAYHERYPGIRILLTGGDAPFFEKYLKASIFVAPNLVLIGLNRILQHNVSR